ncbi:daptide biosynthesis RiPP recognition protein [Streptomyces acidiscabies]|uniref:daptide biosynthesis RiPP recognition protein n=1 Tax=Streptomyces acidiscabies TaxID=42234 RepID=UPI000AFDEF7F|nr:daptide biosynthesis RiPP recognition protein [Streptomyces acidiscabies]
MNEELIARVGHHLRSWVTGRPLGAAAPESGDMSSLGTATVVLEDAAGLDALLGSDVVGAGTVVLAPETRGHRDATVVGYEGSLSGSEGDASVDDVLFLQIQDYGVSPYMSLLGTTLVRMSGVTDFELFLADADAARGEGRFASFAVSPAVQLADLSALGARVPGDGPGTRLYVGGDGGVSVSPQGLRLGTVGDSAAELRAEWERLNAVPGAVPGAVPLGAAVPEALRGDAVRQRPWLARYLVTLDVLRDLQTRGITEPRVSGFGHRLVPELVEFEGALDVDDPEAPILCWTAEQAYVRVPGIGRTFQLGRRDAEITELVLVLGAAEAAARHPNRAEVERVLAFFAGKGVVVGELPSPELVLEATS